jgi:hypothetical protein
VLEQATDLIGAGYHRKLIFHPGAGKVLFAPRHFQRGQIQKLHRRGERVDTGGGELALLDQVELVVAYGLQIELLGAAAEIAGELGDIMDVASLCGGRKVAQLHVFDETLT